MDIATPTTRRSLREPLSALALFAGGLAWIAAFWFPAFYTGQGAVEGYWVFITGWMGFAIFQFAWYANLFMLLGIGLMYSSPLWGSAFAGVGMLVATQAFWFNSIPTGEADMPILQIGQGFWCWYGSMILLGVGVFLGSEQREAEKNQSTNHKRTITPEPKLSRIPESESIVVANAPLTPVALVALEEPVDAVVIKAEAAPPNNSVVSLIEDIPAANESESAKSMPFAIVPEPDLPNFTDLSAANEQDYFQLSNEQALKPAYTEHLAEDWPPKMSLVVSSDPVPNLEAKTVDLVNDQLDNTVHPAILRSPEPQPSSAAFFDPWKT